MADHSGNTGRRPEDGDRPEAAPGGPHRSGTQPETFADELPAGTSLMRGQYTITRFLNAGGFGITYLARDSLDRPVVIKECFPAAFCRRVHNEVQARSRSHQDELEAIVRLFGHEARSLARLVHPNIVGVHQVFEENNTAYMSLDFVEGRDLLDMIEDKAWRADPEGIVRTLRLLLGAIRFVHSEGMLHRDLSPDNIVIRPDGTPVLIDFGAAREQASKQSRILSALRVVKDGYSPQEFYIGGAEQSASSDLYALGASFYHAIARELPPDSQTRLGAVAGKQPDPYVSLVGRVQGFERSVLASIDAALELLPKDRPQSAQEWLEMLDRKRRVSRSVSRLMTPSSAQAVGGATAPKRSGKALMLGSAACVALIAGVALTQFDLLGGSAELPVVAATQSALAEDVTTSPPSSLLVEDTQTAATDIAEAQDPLGATGGVLTSDVGVVPVALAEPDVPDGARLRDSMKLDAPGTFPAKDAKLAAADSAATPETVPREAASTAPVNEMTDHAAPSAPAMARAAPAEGVAETPPEDGAATGPTEGSLAQAEAVETATPGPLRASEEQVASTAAQPDGAAAQPGPPVQAAVAATEGALAPVRTGGPAAARGADTRPDIADGAMRDARPVLGGTLLTGIPGTTVAQAQFTGGTLVSMAAALRPDAPTAVQPFAAATPAPITAPTALEGAEVLPDAHAPKGIGPGKSIVVRAQWGVDLPFPSDSDVTVVSVNGIEISSLAEVGEAVRRTRHLGEETEIPITFGMRNDISGTIEEQAVVLPVVQTTALMNGMTFESRFSQGAWRTTLASLPGDSQTDMKPGDEIIGFVPTNTLIDRRTALSDLVQAEVAKGTTTFSFSVRRDGEMWVAGFEYNVATLSN